MKNGVQKIAGEPPQELVYYIQVSGVKRNVSKSEDIQSLQNHGSSNKFSPNSCYFNYTLKLHSHFA